MSESTLGRQGSSVVGRKRDLASSVRTIRSSSCGTRRTARDSFTVRGVLTKAWRLARSRPIDVGIVGLAIANEIELAVTHVELNMAVQAPLSIFWAAPLLFRRRFPLAAPTVVFASFAVDAMIDPHGLKNLNVAFLCALAATMTMGAIGELRQALAGGAIALAVLYWVSSRTGPTSAGDYIGTTVLFTVAWLIGFLLSTRGRAAREAEARAATAVAEERARLARELHDIVGHSVSVMTVQTAGVRRLLLPEQEREREALLTVEQTGREALAEMRRLVGVLRRPEEAPALAPQPGLGHVVKLVEQAREAGLRTDLRVEGEAVELPAVIDLTAYRLVQEGLTNALKHARADRAEVLVRYDNGRVELVVRDDGRGGTAGSGGGHGLVGMRERVAVCGGELHAGPRPDGGFELRALLPVTET
jgi:signal transduction histidine kinase